MPPDPDLAATGFKDGRRTIEIDLSCSFDTLVLPPHMPPRNALAAAVSWWYTPGHALRGAKTDNVR